MSKEYKFRYKFVALFLALSLAVLILTTCNGAEEITTTTTTDGQSTTPTPPTEEEEIKPPPEESTDPVLTDGTHSWRLTATAYGDKKLELSMRELVTHEGWVVLELEFEKLSEVSLTGAYFNEREVEDPGIAELFFGEGIGHIYVTDSQGSKHAAVVLATSKIAFFVPENQQDFTLYFFDWEPFAIDI